MGSSGFLIAEQGVNKLRVVAPGWSFAQSWMSLLMVGLIALIMYLTSRTVRRVYALEKSPAEVATAVLRYRLLGIGLIVVALLFVGLFSYTRGEIDMDRGTNEVTMRSKMTVFLPEQVQTVPLDSVEEAWLDAKPNARRIRLLRHHGPDMVYPIWSDRPGQQEAVDAINSFVGRSDR